MEEKKKDISGWYVQKELTPEEKAAKMKEIEAWYQKKHRLNYRTVPLEIPGKMMLALGKESIAKKMDFSEHIENILDDYLRRKKVDWRKLKR